MKLDRFYKKINWLKSLAQYNNRSEIFENHSLLNNNWEFHFHQGVYENLANKNIIASKQNFYDASIISLYETVKRNSNEYLWDYNRIASTLLSDSVQIQELFMNVDNQEISLLRTTDGCIFSAFQNVITNKEYLLKLDIENILLRASNKSEGAKLFNELFVRYFQSIISKDKDEISHVINLFLESKFRKNRHSGTIIDDFFARPEAALVKLAWMQGLEIEINHPLIPMDLMPIKPNQEYIDTHNLLKEIVHQ